MKVTADNNNVPAPPSLYEDVFMNIPAATALVSHTAEVVAFNAAFETLFQVSKNEVSLPLSFEEVSSSFWKKPDVQQHLHDVLENNADGEEITFDWQHEDGTLRYVKVQSQLLPSNSRLCILTFCDATHLKQIENDNHLRIRHMMHELRNPLSNISLCVELLADSTKENNQEDTDMFLSKASASVQRMKQLINDLNATRKAS